MLGAAAPVPTFTVPAPTNTRPRLLPALLAVARPLRVMVAPVLPLRVTASPAFLTVTEALEIEMLVLLLLMMLMPVLVPLDVTLPLKLIVLELLPAIVRAVLARA